MLYNEDTRVKFPALVHFTRLGYEYVSLQCNKECFDPETNIHIHTFCNAINRINNTQIDIKEAKKIIKELGLNSSNFDLGFLFYENLIKGYKGKKIIDFSQNDKNIYQIITEYSYIKDKDKFRPDITVLINGIPIAFVEVKKPNNTKGIQAEVERMSNRLRNENFRQFFNMFQIMVFSNNSEYDEREAVPTQGAFYSTTAKDKIILNYFREEHYQELVNSLMPIDKEKEKLILKDNNCLSILSSPEYKTNIDPGTPTNRIISSLFYKERLKMFLKYGIVYVRKTLNTGIKKLEKHIMRYPQLFATQAIKAKLDAGEKKGIIWHTQGSGKTALAYYNIKVLKDYFQDKGIIAQFYFIVDRISLANQAEEEFRSRGIQVNLIRDIKHFENYISNNIEASNNHGEDSVVVVNIQKFSDKSIVKDSSYNTNIQRVYFIDEAHRSYNPSGCFLAHLFCSDKNAIKIALTGTPLIGAVYDKQGQYIKGKKYDSKQIFGQYIHKYYYNKSIKDRYTLRLIREEILTTFVIILLQNHFIKEEMIYKSLTT